MFPVSGDKTRDALAGAIIGGTIGNNVTKNVDNGAAVGALLGGIICPRTVKQLAAQKEFVPLKQDTMKRKKKFTAPVL